ncbi:hypothetical protein UFOVP419_44 [uncultured Caudovirales phage]|jgi:hypothetical protein|uniref:Tail completion protein n=1 Tax=uncultured Caudovirales phage TaxID=2100421 RepID=A0A6J5M4W8_9CAUD|nr:hypothetical protein UFOVP419_44 [uncultured Caudovirales phage]
MSITQIRTALATNLATIPGLRTAAEVPDNPTPPIAIVNLDSVTYDQAYAKGMTNYNFTITVVVGRSAEREAQRKLDGYITPGANSVKNAIESDKTLGGYAYDCRVVSLNSVGSLTISDTTYLAADFSVTVIAN